MHAQGDLNMRNLRMFEGTFSLDTANVETFFSKLSDS